MEKKISDVEDRNLEMTLKEKKRLGHKKNERTL